MTVRQPVCAGTFYPAARDTLREEIRGYLGEPRPPAALPKAIIAPHAGYKYSGPVAASAYAPFYKQEHSIERVVLLGPSHRVAFRGLALSGATSFATPLGELQLDVEAMSRVKPLPQVKVLDEAHAEEHALEVHLPFLQEVLGNFRLVPIVVGEADPDSVAEVLDLLWGGPETLIVVSSDLSHFYDADRARELDRRTAESVVALRPVHHEDACGRGPINGLLEAVRRRGLKVRTLDLRNSGDTTGSTDRVVGYGAFAVEN